MSGGQRQRGHREVVVVRGERGGGFTARGNSPPHLTNIVATERKEFRERVRVRVGEGMGGSLNPDDVAHLSTSPCHQAQAQRPKPKAQAELNGL